MPGTGASEGNVLIYNWNDFSFLKKTGNDEILLSLPSDFLFSKKSNQIIESRGDVFFVDLSDPTISTKIEVRDENSGALMRANALALSPNDEFLASATGDRRIVYQAGERPLPPSLKIWRIATRQLVASYPTGGGKLSWSFDGKYLAVSSGKVVRVISVDSAVPRIRSLHFFEKIGDVSFSPKENLLAVSSGKTIFILSI